MTQFDGTGTGQQADPFGAAPDVSSFPKMDALRGKLLLITPTRLETGLLSQFSKPGQPQFQDRITANVVVLDGLPVTDATGAPFDTNEFTAMYFSQSRLVSQLSPNVGTGRGILGRLDTFKPGEKAAAGNPWGILPMTDQDAAMARAYLAGDRSMLGTPAPVAQPQPTAQAAPAAGPGNPWAAQQAAPAAPAAPANPWAQTPAPAAGPGNPWAPQQ